MIGVRLMGGLGNQMFQYATAESLARANHTGVAIDQVFLENSADIDTPRIYELDCFAFDEHFIQPSKRPFENPDAVYSGNKGKLRFIKHLAKGTAWHVYREPHHNFDSELLKQPNRSYLIGYWQTEKYFADIRDILLKDFEFKSEATGNNKKLLENIKQSESISIHVRRGDYVTNKHANAFHGTKDKKYYGMALEPILKKTKSPVLFVFSDDPAWCKQNLKFKQKTVYVEGNQKGFEDMRLMLNCKHNVIANSSFSWWAAWLNQNPDKIVVAPKKWFNDPSANTKDILPEPWLKI